MKTFTFVFSICYFSVICAFDSTVPVLHLPDYFDETRREVFLSDLEDAAKDVGFFALTGTGVDPAFLDSAYAQMKEFFDQDFETKNISKSPDGQRGYIPGESAKGETRVDYKEFFHIGRDLSSEDTKRCQYAENVWPEQPQQFRVAMQELHRAMDSSKEALADAFSALLKQGPGFVSTMVCDGDCLLRAIHYPANPPADAVWAGAHTDIVLFTILPRATAKGLQVMNKEGEWIDVIVPDNAFVINCGDMLENLTNGYFKSSFHRVVDPGSGKDRYSAVFFVHPKSEDRLDPLPEFIEKTGGKRVYANVNRIELLAERLIDLGIASPSLMSFFVESGAIERLKEVGRFSPKAEQALQEAGLITQL